MGIFNIFDTYSDKFNRDSGFDILYNYLSSNSKGMNFDNTNPEYRHSRVTIEIRSDFLCIFIVLPIEYKNTNEIISVRLKRNDKKANVSITSSLNEVIRGYIDLTTYNTRDYWGTQIAGCNVPHWKTEDYEKHLANGLVFLESHIKEKFGVSLWDLGFTNFYF